MEGVSHRDRYGAATATPTTGQQYGSTSIPGEYNSNLQGSNLQSSNFQGNATSGSESPFVGPMPDGPRRLNTSRSYTPLTQDTINNDNSSVSNLTSSDRSPNRVGSTLQTSGYHPPRGSAVRTHSDAAPESLTGVPERGQSVRQFGQADQNPISPITTTGPRTDWPSNNTNTTQSSMAPQSNMTQQPNMSTQPNMTQQQQQSSMTPQTNITQQQPSMSTQQNTTPQPTGYSTYGAVTGTGDDYNSSGEGGKKQSTISKLFKRKPIGGAGETGSYNTTDADRKKYY